MTELVQAKPTRYSVEERRLSKLMLLYLNIETNRIGSSTAWSSFVIEISRGPSTRPEPIIRKAITMPANGHVFNVLILHQT